jgi:Flp pilus assembly pilin Flp
MHNMLMTYAQAFLQRLGRDEEGQTAVEYALVLALVALVIVAILATGATSVINTVVAQLTNAV